MEEIRLAKPWTGPTLTNVPYFMVRWTRHTDPRIYGVRLSDYLARLKGIPENLDEVAAEIHADREAVDAAMALLVQIETNVDHDRQAAENAAGSAQGAASTAVSAATSAQVNADIIQGLLNMPLDMGNQSEPLGQTYDLGTQGT